MGRLFGHGEAAMVAWGDWFELLVLFSSFHKSKEPLLRMSGATGTSKKYG
jgi:hypothetical protein